MKIVYKIYGNELFKILTLNTLEVLKQFQILLSFQKFNGNTDDNTVVKNTLPSVVRARYIRFIPTDYSGWPYLRVDVFGSSV